MGCARACGVVGADVPGGPRSRWRPRGRPRGRGAPGTSRPTMGCARACGVVGADVLGGPRSRGRPRGRPRGRGAPGTSRPTMGCARVWRGRGRRPRRPAFPWTSPWTSPWARRAGDVAPARRMPFPARRGKWALPFARLNGQVLPSPPPTYFFNRLFNRRDSASPANEGAHLLPRPRFWYNDAD